MLPDRAVAAGYSDASRNRDFLRSRSWNEPDRRPDERPRRVSDQPIDNDRRRPPRIRAWRCGEGLIR